MRLWWRCAAVVVLVITTVSPSGAQTVRGTVVGRGDVPLAGVVVVLADSAGPVGRSLSGERGEFRVTASRPGTYRLQATRIGFRPIVSAWMTLAADDTRDQRLIMDGISVALDTVRVVGGRRSCRVDGDSALATHLVWEQVRAALSATQETTLESALFTTTVTYQRTLDVSGRRVRQQASNAQSGVVAQPWSATPPRALSREGYIAAVDDSIAFRAPSAEALVSAEFLSDHCFELVAAPDTSRIGIGFTPASRRSVPEIRGTMWVDRASSELRSLEFRYVNTARYDGGGSNAGGELRFARLPNGRWVVTRWSIRMPVLGRADKSADLTMRQPSIVGIQEAGGQLVLARREADTLWSLPPFTVSGVVVDSASGGLIRGARVQVDGTSREVASGEDGRFSMAGIAPGAYTLSVRTPALDSLNIVHQASLFLIDSAAPAQVRVPSAPQVEATLCGKPREQRGILIGTAVSADTSATPQKIAIVGEWIDARHEHRWIETSADARGGFRLCGLPLNTDIIVRATVGSTSAAELSARLTGLPRLARVTLELANTEGNAVFAGAVVDSAQRPLSNVQVTFPDLARVALTDEAGKFRLAGLPAGSHRFVVRKIGYGPVDTSLTIGADERVDRNVVLSRVVMLDSVRTVARGSDLEFEENRKIGLGHFFTRADLEKQEGRRLSEVLAQAPAARAVSIGPRGGYISTSRGPRTMNPVFRHFESGAPDPRSGLQYLCYANVYLDGMRLYGGGDNEIVPDINRFDVANIESIEYYASAAQTPAKYSALNSTCGVVVIHTRRFP